MEKFNAGPPDLLGRVRVASPCPASWDAMEGDERARFCRLCSLNVYNFSALTRAEAEALVARAEGRLCARFYRRADGTILTRDCPTGLRAVRRRVRRGTAALFAAITSLWTAAAGQTSPPKDVPDQHPAPARDGDGRLKLRRKPTPAGEQAGVSGVVSDPLGVLIFNAAVILINELTKEERHAATGDDGAFSFADPEPGTYTLRLAAAGFKDHEFKGIKVVAEESLRVEVVMEVGHVMETIGIVTLDVPLNRGGEIVIDAETIRRLPRP